MQPLPALNSWQSSGFSLLSARITNLYHQPGPLVVPFALSFLLMISYTTFLLVCAFTPSIISQSVMFRLA